MYYISRQYKNDLKIEIKCNEIRQNCSFGTNRPFAEVMECSSRKNWDWALYSGITLFQMNNGGKIAKGEYMQNNYSEGNFVYDSLNDSGMLNINFGHYFSNNSESFWKSKKLRRRDVTNIMFRMIVNTSATSVTCWIGQSAGGDTGTVVCEDGTVADVRCVGRTSKGTYVNYSEFLVGVLPSKSEASHDFQIAKKEGVIAQW